jgi:hypothetical protein
MVIDYAKLITIPEMGQMFDINFKIIVDDR